MIRSGNQDTLSISIFIFFLFFFYSQNIIASYNKQSGMTVQEAKIAFLQGISGWTTFGCAFFEVKVSYQGGIKAKSAEND